MSRKSIISIVAVNTPSGNGPALQGRMDDDELDQIVGGLNPCPLPPREEHSSGPSDNGYRLSR
jgi:hypothetical protein